MLFKPSVDRYDELRREWIAEHSAIFTMQIRRAELLNRRIRRRHRFLAQLLAGILAAMPLVAGDRPQDLATAPGAVAQALVGDLRHTGGRHAQAPREFRPSDLFDLHETKKAAASRGFPARTLMAPLS